MDCLRHCEKLLFIVLVGCTIGCQHKPYLRLPKETYLDKCKGAWAGQMIGVCYGAPYEFRSTGKPILQTLQPWKPERIKGVTGQDDCYVEMTFLMALEKYGLDIRYQQAAKEFGASEYKLAHANYVGRENIRAGIMPPRSGHPKYNRHADDIDFQIEADLFGIICPGMPRESNRLGDVFGHMMNYGDGVYGGLFVAGMYTAAYFVNEDVDKVIRSGLACIPEQSLYHQCISDVLRWYRKNPGDWLATWNKVEAKWNDDVDCKPNNPSNIDAKLNGAYIVVGLLYGGGDMLKTMEITTRCGQDADCNASSAAGVLGCMKGYQALDKDLIGGISQIADTNFAFTRYCFKTLIPACQRMTEKVIVRAGGKISGDIYFIPQQVPIPARLEQWTNQEEILSLIVPEWEVALWDPAWKLKACGREMFCGIRRHPHDSRIRVLQIYPVSEDEPAVLVGKLEVPKTNNPKLYVNTASHRRGDYLLKVFINEQLACQKLIQTKGEYVTESINLGSYAGKTIQVRLEAHANNWKNEMAYFARVEIR